MRIDINEKAKSNPNDRCLDSSFTKDWSYESYDIIFCNGNDDIVSKQDIVNQVVKKNEKPKKYELYFSLFCVCLIFIFLPLTILANLLFLIGVVIPMVFQEYS